MYSIAARVADGVVPRGDLTIRVVNLTLTNSILERNHVPRHVMVPPRSAQVGLGHGVATCAHRRWFRVLVRKAGGLEPHGVGPI